MKQRIVIHVGMPRAGSSTFQEAMFSHRDLLRKEGIFYAAIQKPGATDPTQGFEYNHRLLNVAAKGFFRPQKSFSETIKSIVEGARAYPNHITVLSYEGWWDPRNRVPFHRILREIEKQLPHAEVELAAVVREPVSFLMSLYRLDVLHGRTGGSFVEYVPKALSDPRLKYESIASALTGAAGKVTFLDFDALSSSGQFCGHLLGALTGTDLLQNPRLDAFCNHRSGGSSFFSDAVITMLRFASCTLGLKTVQHNREDLQEIMLRLTCEPQLTRHCAELVIPLSRETAEKITLATRPLVQNFYARHLPAANTRFATVYEGRTQSDIQANSTLGHEVLNAMSAFKGKVEP